MTGNAALMKRSDSHARRGTTPSVPAKVKDAVEILLTTAGAPDYAVIAAAVGYRNAYELRKQLMKPPAIRHLRDRKRQVLESINAGNPEALRKVRDESGNSMAKVQAVRALESMGHDMDETSGNRHGPVAPGFTIVIKGPAPADAPPDNTVVIFGGPQPGPRPAVIDAGPDEFRAAD